MRGDEVARGKPAPDVFIEAARRLGVEAADCLVFEDAPMGIEAAQAAGMRVVALTTSFQACAFRAARSAADLVCGDFDELPALIPPGADSAAQRPRPPLARRRRTDSCPVSSHQHSSALTRRPTHEESYHHRVAALLGHILPQPDASLNAAPVAQHVTAGTVKVTVHYKGKGKVDASHKFWVWLFDTPNIGAGSMPIDQIALDKNGADAVFDGVAATRSTSPLRSTRAAR